MIIFFSNRVLLKILLSLYFEINQILFFLEVSNSLPNSENVIIYELERSGPFRRGSDHRMFVCVRLGSDPSVLRCGRALTYADLMKSRLATYNLKIY